MLLYLPIGVTKMTDCINGAKKLIEEQVRKNKIEFSGIKFSEYQKTYFWTNEQIGDYLGVVDLEGKDNALTVTASGDHTFNLITKGILNIDTFDTNKLTEFFAFGFKRAMILKYNYNDFCIIIERLRSTQISIEELNEIILGLLPFMETRHRIFWQSILDFNYNTQRENETNLNLFLMLSLEKQTEITIANKFFNNFLIDEEHYELLRTKLGLANITFTHAEAINLREYFANKYDVILLSNILDYFYKRFGRNWNYDDLQKYVEELKTIMKPDGIIFLHYILSLLRKNDIYRKQIFNCSTISLEDLINEELILLPEVNNVTNAIILKRIK